MFLLRYKSLEINLVRPGYSQHNLHLKPNGRNNLQIIVTDGIVGTLQIKKPETVSI